MATGIGAPLKRGFFQQDRAILHSEIFGNKERMAVWQYLTSQVAYVESKFWDGRQLLAIKPGQLFCSMRLASRECGLARQTFKRTLVYMLRRGLVKFATMKSGTLVTLAKSILSAVCKPRGASQTHKEIKVINRSYNNLPSYIATPPSAVGIMNPVSTQKYLDDLSKYVPSRTIPGEAMALLRRFKEGDE
jgi:hypothetical protein